MSQKYYMYFELPRIFNLLFLDISIKRLKRIDYKFVTRSQILIYSSCVSLRRPTYEVLVTRQHGVKYVRFDATVFFLW